MQREKEQKKSLSLNEKTEKNFLGEKVRRMGQPADLKKKRETDRQTEKAPGLGRRTREGRAKWNQMTALKFQTGGETQDIPGHPCGKGCKATVSSGTTSYSEPGGDGVVRRAWHAVFLVSLLFFL